MSFVGLLFGPTYRAYKSRPSGTLSNYIRKNWQSLNLNACEEAMGSTWEKTVSMFRAHWVELLSRYPESYTIRRELGFVKKWVADSAKHWAAASQQLSTRYRVNPDVKSIDKASDRILKSIADVKAFSASIKEPEKFILDKRKLSAAFIARVLFWVTIPLNCIFALSALTGGQLLNATPYHFGLAAIAVLGFEVGGGALLYYFKSWFGKIIASITVLAGCIAEAFFAIQSGFIISIFEAASLPIFSESSDPYALPEPTSIGLACVGGFGLTMGILIAAITHNYFQKVGEAKDIKTHRKLATRQARAWKRVQNLEKNLSGITLTSDALAMSLDTTKDKLFSQNLESASIAKSLASSRKDFLKKVSELTDRNWTKEIEAQRPINETRMRAALVLPIAVGVLFLAFYLLNYNLLSGLELMDGTVQHALSVAVTIFPFALGAVLFRPILNSVSDNDGHELARPDLSHFGKPTLVIITICVFIIALNRDSGLLSGFSGSLALTSIITLFAWSFMLCGSHFHVINEGLLFSGAILLLLVRFCGIAFFIAARFACLWVAIAAIALFELLFFLLALPWTLWGNVFGEIRKLRS